MKRLKILTFVMLMLVVLCGCDAEKVHLTIPLEAEEITYAEMFRHGILRGEPVSVEKKTVTSAEDIQALINGLERPELEPVQRKSNEYTTVYAFRFYPTNDKSEPFEITYYYYGVKNGILCVQGDETDYFTIANVGWNWAQLNDELIAVPAEESDLPK